MTLSHQSNAGDPWTKICAPASSCGIAAPTSCKGQLLPTPCPDVVIAGAGVCRKFVDCKMVDHQCKLIKNAQADQCLDCYDQCFKGKNPYQDIKPFDDCFKKCADQHGISP